MELQRLSELALDNGHWDQAFEYADGRRPGFINENFTRNGLDTLHVQLMWIADEHGKTRVAMGVRSAPVGKVAPPAPDLLTRMERDIPVLVPLASSDSRVGLMR